MSQSQSTIRLVLPTTTLCASSPSSAGFQGGSDRLAQHHPVGNTIYCETSKILPTSDVQGGHKPVAITSDAFRHIAPDDDTLTETTYAEEPTRRIGTANNEWARDELPQTPVFPPKPEINHILGNLVSGFHDPQSPYAREYCMSPKQNTPDFRSHQTPMLTCPVKNGW